MKIKLSNGKPRGDGLFLISHHHDDELELVFIDRGWIFNYPNMNFSTPIESYDIHGWRKLDVEDAPDKGQ